MVGSKSGSGERGHCRGPGERTAEVAAMENLMGLTNILEKETVKLGADWASDVQMRDTDFKDDS